MLTLTENASLIVKEIASQEGLPETAGLRITSESESDPSFAVTAADATPALLATWPLTLLHGAWTCAMKHAIASSSTTFVTAQCGYKVLSPVK